MIGALTSPLLRLQRGGADLLGALAVTHEPPAARRSDGWIAGGVLVLGALEVGAEETAYAYPAARLLLVVAVGVGVVWRRVHPLWISVAAFGSQALLEVATAVDGSSDSGTPGGQALGMMLIVYALCRWAPARDMAVGFGSVVLFAVIAEVARNDPSDVAFGTVSPWLLAGLVGVVMRYRSVLQANRVEQVRLQERNALARELHDSVAHHVSAIAVQAQAAQFVAATDPAAARQAMREVEETANRAIDEMRQMVGVLRSAADIARSVAHESLADLADPHGHPRVVVAGQTDLTALPPAVGAALYRVAQESLTNARKHARAASNVEIATSAGPSEVVMTVVDDGQRQSGARGDGFGLIGMDERLRALGGTLRAGPLPERGWKVEARIPRTGGGVR